MTYSFTQFQEDFPTEEACFDFLVGQNRYPCTCGGVHQYKIKGKRTLSCSCGRQVSPLKGTIFEGSKTSLRKWVFALYLFSQARNGISAEELRRQLGVTYKCAFRMGHKIRSLTSEGNKMNVIGKSTEPRLEGVVEADETYFGHRKGRGKPGRGTSKAPVFGMVERGGRVRAKVVPNVKALTLLELLAFNVKVGSSLVTDELPAYNYVPLHGLWHYKIRHKTRIYGRTNSKGFKIHTNSCEGFWSHLKRHIRGTHVGVSQKYLQKYLDEQVYRYNHRLVKEHPFHDLLRRSSLSSLDRGKIA